MRSKKEELSIEINDAGGWQEYYQTKNKNSTMEAHYTEKYQRLKKQYAELVEKENIERFQKVLEEL
jgi:hypothetical protein